MTDTKNMVLEGFRENTMTKEQLLAPVSYTHLTLPTTSRV